jgi:hypothetical protein
MMGLSITVEKDEKDEEGVSVVLTLVGVVVLAMVVERHTYFRFLTRFYNTLRTFLCTGSYLRPQCAFVLREW